VQEQRRPVASSTYAHRPSSRSNTARLTAAGTWRERAEVSVSSTVFFGLSVVPKRWLSSLPSKSVTASPTTSARSQSGFFSRSRAWARSSLSRSSALAVNRTE